MTNSCQRRIGIAWEASFDPIHYGHLRAADEAHAAFGLSGSDLRPYRAASPTKRGRGSLPWKTDI